MVEICLPAARTIVVKEKDRYRIGCLGDNYEKSLYRSFKYLCESANDDNLSKNASD